MLTGANVATVIVMLLVGFSDRLNPTDHPLVSTVGMAFPVLLVINMGFLLFWLIFKWTRAWVPVAGFILSYVPISIYMPLNVSPSPPEGALKLVSYNVCSYGGNFKYEQGFEKVRDYLIDEKADIVCLQEDNDSWRRYCFKQLEERGLTYNDTVVLFNDELRFNCLGIHSKYPIIRRERIDYKTVSESQLLMVKLAEANAVRSKQIETVCQYVSQYLGRYPIIVCGDFNDNPISFSRHRMGKMLTDCFVESGRGVGLSYNQKAFSFRIDHIFCSADITPYQCEVDTKMDASDHFPMVCWLKIGVK